MSAGVFISFGSTSAHLFDYGVTVSLAGSFNPHAFQPAGLASLEILTRQEGADPEGLTVQPEFLRFATEHITLEATRELVEITSRAADVDELRIREIAEGLTREFQHPPVSGLSIARYGHFSFAEGQEPVELVNSAFESVSAQLAIGGGSPTPSPQRAQTWQGVVLPGLWDDLLHAPRLDELTMRGDRTDGYAGNVSVTIEPSLIVRGGLFLAHIDIIQTAGLPQLGESPEKSVGSSGAQAILADIWDPTKDRAFAVFETLSRALAVNKSEEGPGDER